MKLKTNYTSTEFMKQSYKLLIYVIIFSLSTIALVDWYIDPVLTGFNQVNDYYDFDYLAITGFDQRLEEMKIEFKDDFITVTNNNNLTIDESVDILRLKLDGYEDEMFNDFAGVVLYQFAPILTLPAVIYFHIKFWSWVCIKLSNLFKLNVDKKIRIWNDECKCQLHNSQGIVGK